MKLYEIDGRVFVEVSLNYLVYVGTVAEVEAMDASKLFKILSEILAKDIGFPLGQSKGVH